MATGNSYSYQKSEQNKNYLIKKFDSSREYYFYHEYFTNKYLYNLDPNYVAKIYKINKTNYEIYYEFLPQRKVIGNENSIDYIDIIKSIHRKSEKSSSNFNLYAKESFKSLSQTFINIENRIQKISSLKSLDNQDLIEHLLHISLFLNLIRKNIFSNNIFSSEKFSHADSGIHNCILNKNGMLLINDLEYAGLDSPIKQCIDYLLHPKNNNNSLQNELWFNYFINDCIHEKDIKNLKFYFSLFALKWSLILLNEFIPEIWDVRVHAYPLRLKNHDIILNNQLEKSKIYFKKAKEIIDNEKTTNLFSKSEKIFISKSY